MFLVKVGVYTEHNLAAYARTTHGHTKRIHVYYNNNSNAISTPEILAYTHISTSIYEYHMNSHSCDCVHVVKIDFPFELNIS